MMAVLGFYNAQLRASLALMFQYRVAMAIWMIGLIIEPVIYLAVWATVANSNDGVVGNFTVGDFAAYYIVVLVVQHFTQIWHMWEYDYVIRQGILSGRMLRPIHPIHRDAAENIAYKIIMLPIVIVAIVILVIAFRPVFAPPLWSALAFIPSLILSAVLTFLLGWALAMAAFWTTRIMAINQTYFIMMFFFSGQIAPLELIPPFLQAVANVLPFRWMLSFPVELAMGRLSAEQAVSGFLMQALWVLIALGVMRLAWTRGVKRYAAFGG